MILFERGNDCISRGTWRMVSARCSPVQSTSKHAIWCLRFMVQRTSTRRAAATAPAYIVSKLLVRYQQASSEPSIASSSQRLRSARNEVKLFTRSRVVEAIGNIGTECRLTRGARSKITLHNARVKCSMRSLARHGVEHASCARSRAHCRGRRRR